MKKLMIMMLLVLATNDVLAQKSEKNNAVFSSINFEMKTIYGLKQHNMQPMNLDMQLSFSYSDRLSLQVIAERNLTLFDMDGGKQCIDGNLLGGGLAYVWMKDSHYRYDVRLQILNSLGSPKLKQTVYDFGVNLYSKREERSISPVMGLGFRYQKSHTAGIRDWCGFYASVGVRF